LQTFKQTIYFNLILLCRIKWIKVLQFIYIYIYETSYGGGKTSKRFPEAVVSQFETVNADDKQRNGQNRWSEKKRDVIEN